MDLLGEKTFLLTGSQSIAIEKIHESTGLIKQMLGTDLLDIVPAYSSIAIFTDLTLADLVELLVNSKKVLDPTSVKMGLIEIPICYELALDLEELAAYAGLPVEEVINLHLSCKYQSLFIGFTPGFIYAGGLDSQLACQRKSAPRKRLEAGSVGIGGNQSGIYSLASPGGWNIIGRTPLTLFDPQRDQPMMIEVGTPFHFYRITQKEFEQWEN